MILVDTDVMVDVMRRHSPAIAWLDSLGPEAMGIPGLVAPSLYMSRSVGILDSQGTPVWHRPHP